jgi:transcriptional regulator with XRE-family HTH domain
VNRLNERLKKLRKTLDLTQQEFADRIGSKRNTIAKYETDTNVPSAAVISLICREFNVNENWLRTGEGDMFMEMSRDEQIEEFIGDLLHGEEDSFKRRLISGLAALDENGWKVLEDFLDSIQKKRG